MKIKLARGLSLLTGMMMRSFDNFDGLLLVFPFSDRWGLWMPLCPPMDLAFLDERGRVIEKQTAVPLGINPSAWRTYVPKKPCRYVLELRSGLGKKFRAGRTYDMKALKYAAEQHKTWFLRATRRLAQ